MIIISHRGNLNGPDKSIENSPKAIDQALRLGLDCEVDLWWSNQEGWLLGHDYGEFAVDASWLLERRDNLWIHAKNFEAFQHLYYLGKQLHFFWHQEDMFTITSRGIVWCFPSPQIYPDFVNVLPELNFSNPAFFSQSTALGVCTDYAIDYSLLAQK